jgi:hypothetical protein
MELKGYSGKVKDHQVEVVNTNSGAGVKLQMDRSLHRMVFWSSHTTYCPENFIFISVKPGEKETWTSNYTLFIE